MSKEEALAALDVALEAVVAARDRSSAAADEAYDASEAYKAAETVALAARRTVKEFT